MFNGLFNLIKKNYGDALENAKVVTNLMWLRFIHVKMYVKKSFNSMYEKKQDTILIAFKNPRNSS